MDNRFVVLTDHKAIISALKTNRVNKTHQSRLTRWADQLLPFDFDVLHISGCKLGIVDYLSRFPTFEEPRPCNFDEQNVVICISRFFDACDFSDRWVHDSSSSDSLSDTSPAKMMNKPFRALSTSINSIESGNHCHIRQFYPVKEILPHSVGNSLLTDCAQPIEGVDFTVVRNLCQGVTPLEAICSCDIRINELINQCKRNKSVVNYPIEGVRISAQNFSQSASSWFISLNVTFPACFLNC